MSKPKVFWIALVETSLGPQWQVSPSKFEDAYHMREVREIDWEKVWKAYWGWHSSMKNENMYVDKIQQLVEKQLTGEE